MEQPKLGYREINSTNDSVSFHLIFCASLYSFILEYFITSHIHTIEFNGAILSQKHTQYSDCECSTKNYEITKRKKNNKIRIE